MSEPVTLEFLAQQNRRILEGLAALREELRANTAASTRLNNTMMALALKMQVTSFLENQIRENGSPG